MLHLLQPTTSDVQNLDAEPPRQLMEINRPRIRRTKREGMHHAISITLRGIHSTLGFPFPERFPAPRVRS